MSPAPEALEVPGATPGYPEHTSRFTLRVDRDQAKVCHATLIDPEWAVTSAHCFSEVMPGASGRLHEFDRGFATSDVFFHPAAHASGSRTLNAVWHDEEFTAAHDLAAVRIEPPLELEVAAAHWNGDMGCPAPDLADLPTRLARLSASGAPETARGVVLGMRNASELLGPLQSGTLLAVRSSGALPGDSGSGVTVLASELAARPVGCAISAGAEAEALLGVLQDANPLDANAPLGVTPLYLPEHTAWLWDTLREAGPAQGVNGEPPRIVDPDNPCVSYREPGCN